MPSSQPQQPRRDDGDDNHGNDQAPSSSYDAADTAVRLANIASHRGLGPRPMSDVAALLAMPKGKHTTIPQGMARRAAEVLIMRYCYGDGGGDGAGASAGAGASGGSGGNKPVLAAALFKVKNARFCGGGGGGAAPANNNKKTPMVQMVQPARVVFAFNGRMESAQGRTTWSRDGVVLIELNSTALATPGEVSGEDVVRTLLHEIGHALCGPQAHHGPEWKRAVYRLGGVPVRCCKRSDNIRRTRLVCSLHPDTHIHGCGHRAKPRWTAMVGQPCLRSMPIIMPMMATSSSSSSSSSPAAGGGGGGGPAVAAAEGCGGGRRCCNGVLRIVRMRKPTTTTK